MAEYCVKSGRIPPKSEWLAAMPGGKRGGINEMKEEEEMGNAFGSLKRNGENEVGGNQEQEIEEGK